MQVEKQAAKLLAVKERARRILIETTLIDAAQAEQASLLEEPVGGPEFGFEAVRALAEDGAPYRGLRKVVLAGETVLAEADDPLYAVFDERVQELEIDPGRLQLIEARPGLIASPAFVKFDSLGV